MNVKLACYCVLDAVIPKPLEEALGTSNVSISFLGSDLASSMVQTAQELGILEAPHDPAKT